MRAPATLGRLISHYISILYKTKPFMKQLLLFVCLSIFTFGLNAQVFVDVDAAGTGDGTSWANAYTNLNDALLAAPAGSSVWIAEGTYTTPDSVSFFIDKELTVLGGFSGTETVASAANPTLHPTILSGDVAGNDVVGTYDSTGYLDNNRVLFIVDTNEVSTFTVTLDGLTIANGGIAQDQPAGASVFGFSGGGILTLAKLNASRLNFVGNRSTLGCTIALITPNASGTVLDSITVSGNFAGANRMVYLNNLSDVVLKNSTFVDDVDSEQLSGYVRAAFASGFTVQNCSFTNLNSTFSGGAIRVDQCTDFSVENCVFDNISSSQGGGLSIIQTNGASITGCTLSNLSSPLGGAIVSFDSDDLVITDSDFDSNSALDAGAIYFQQAANFAPVSGTLDSDDFAMDSCTFTNNSVLAGDSRGGAISAFNSNIKITNSTLSDNLAGDIGGAVYHVALDDRTYETVFTNTTFDSNEDKGAGGAYCVLVLSRVAGGTILADLVGTVDGCTFSNNISDAQGAGAAMYLQGRNNFTITNSVYNENEADLGAIFTSGSNGMILNNVSFIENGNDVNAFRGGALYANFSDDAAGLTIDSSRFEGNLIGESARGFSGGGAVTVLGGVETAVPVIIQNSTFFENSAAGASDGGAVYLLFGLDVSIASSEFLSNSSGGSGGAISIIKAVNQRDTAANGDITVGYTPFSGSVVDSKFFSSGAEIQGGAVSTQNTAIDFTNCAFVNNEVTGGGSGGAIIFNGNAPRLDNVGGILEIGSINIEATLVNNTFVDNFKGGGEFAVGDNLALFQPGDTNDPDSNSMKITLTNNAFLLSSGAPSVEVELGADEPAGFVPVGNLFFESLGGNFFNGENGTDVELGDNGDIFDLTIMGASSVNGLFFDILNDNDEGVNVSLAILGDQGADNPLIDNAVINALTPVTDIDGNPRGDAPDIGAYEADQGAVSTDQPVEDSGLAITFYPNPTLDVLNIQNDDPTITKISVVVSDQAGRILKAARFNGSNNRLDLSAMPVGIYNLQLYVNGNVYSKQIVKQ